MCFSYEGKTSFNSNQEKISKSCTGKRLREKHHNWKGGIVKNYGYVLIRKLDGSGYNKQSHLIVEKYLNRLLEKQEVVHHINGIRDDNRLENLYLFSSEKEHQSYHMCQRYKK